MRPKKSPTLFTIILEQNLKKGTFSFLYHKCFRVEMNPQNKKQYNSENIELRYSHLKVWRLTQHFTENYKLFGENISCINCSNNSIKLWIKHLLLLKMHKFSIVWGWYRLMLLLSGAESTNVVVISRIFPKQSTVIHKKTYFSSNKTTFWHFWYNIKPIN